MESSLSALKSSRKRKKHQTGNPSNNTTKKQKLPRISDTSNELHKKKKFFANKHTKSQAGAIDIQNSSTFGKSNESMNVNMDKTSKKKKFKTREIVNTKPQSLITLQSKSIPKSKKNKMVKKVPSSKLQVSSTVSEDVSMSSDVRKVKKIKNKLGRIASNVEKNLDFESNDELSDICISDDNESDEEALREEIQNFSVFKQIEKLMKKAPHLNPANAGLKSPEDLSDGDVNNSSNLSSSVESDDENSAMDTDNQDVSSSESDLEDSVLKNKIASKKENSSVKLQHSKQHLLINKKDNFSESVVKSTDFNQTSKDNALKRNIRDKGKKVEMSSNLKIKVQGKLAAAKFRFLNEKLYTETGMDAFKYFQENTEEFKDYHSGYRLQVSKWPMNPVNEIIADIQKLKKSLVIADLGCGEAKVAQTFPDRTVHSFDLVPLNEFVKACDVSKVPLSNESVDVVVFCLSLMGTNLKDYLCEAFRILKVGGVLKIAEVESRIEDLDHFLNKLKSIGFKLEKKNTKHKMFVFLDLKKEKQKCKPGKIPSLSLRPCLYKKR